MSNSLAELDRFRSDAFEPTSFRDRGATVPFTTPLLLNARIRVAASGRGFEMVVANPSGGRGALILPWSAMVDICSPTLFDRHLWESLATSSDISPIGIRHEAQRLATLGLAGRQAALAAKDALRREQASQRMVRGMLLESLIAATETTDESSSRPATEDGSAFMKRAKRATARAATVAKVGLAEFAADLEALAVALSGARPKMKGEEGRLRQMMSELKRTTDEITDWIDGEQQEGAHIMAAKFVVATARQTLECGEFALATTDALIADLGNRIPRWRTERDSILESARGPDWVLDGWKTPMALWQAAGPNQRQAAIWEMATIAPILPREGKIWLGEKADWRDTPRRITQVVREKSDWRSGNAMEMVARNENLIGLSIAFENRVSSPAMLHEKVTMSRMNGSTVTGKRDNTPPNISQAKDQSPNGNKDDAKQTTGKASKINETMSLGFAIETASERVLSKIVALVDRLGNAEIHERLLGPSLPRLKRLRPPRPASLMRLLFIPLEGALIDPLQWRRTEGRIPRSALAPLLGAVTARLGPQIEAATLQLRGATLEDDKLIDRVARPLWQAAGLAVPQLVHDASWSRIELGRPEFDAITSLAGALWRHAGPLWDGMQQVAGECTPEALRAALIGPANENKTVFAAAMNGLLQRAARPSVLVPLLQDLPAPTIPIVEDILNKWVGATLRNLLEEDLAAGARLAREIGIVILALEKLPRIAAKTDAKELVAHRRNLDQFCRNTYREVVSVHVIQALLELAVDDLEGIGQIESMARTARTLEDTGKLFGSSIIYEELQDEFRTRMESWLQQETSPAATSMEVARIEEILIGQKVAKRFVPPPPATKGAATGDLPPKLRGPHRGQCVFLFAGH
jgi:hypothetical protein